MNSLKCKPLNGLSLGLVISVSIIIFSSISLMNVSANVDTRYKIKIYVSGYDGESPIIVNLFDLNYTLLYNQTYVGSQIEFPVNDSGEYIVALIYKKVPYVKQVTISNNETVLNFTVYEVIDNDSSIDIPVHHVVINPQGSYLEVMEVVFFRNVGDKVVINGTKIRMYLPPEYRKFNSDIMSCCLENTEWGFIFNLMGNLLPGEAYRVTYTYEIPVSGDAYPFEVEVPYNTEYLLLAVSYGYETENPVNINYRGEIEVENGKYVLFEGYNITKNEKIGLMIKGIGSKNAWVLPLLVVATSGAIIGFSVWSVFRKKPTLEELERKKEELMSRLDELEDRFKKGELDEEEYFRLRIRYKKKVIKVLKKIERLKAREEKMGGRTGVEG